MAPPASSRVPLRPPNELIALCLARAGGLRGIRVASFVNDWAIEERAAGRQIGIEEFISSWSNGRQKTAYNRLKEFRELFEGELGEGCTPHHLIREGAPVVAPSAGRRRSQPA